MASLGMLATLDAHRHFHRQAAKQCGPGTCFDRIKTIRRQLELRRQCEGGFAILGGPKDAIVFFIASQRFGSSELNIQ